jgi:hypothetical protein
MKNLFLLLLVVAFFVLGVFFFLNSMLLAVNENGFVMTPSGSNFCISLVLTALSFMAGKSVYIVDEFLTNKN